MNIIKWMKDNKLLVIIILIILFILNTNQPMTGEKQGLGSSIQLILGVAVWAACTMFIPPPAGMIIGAIVGGLIALTGVIGTGFDIWNMFHPTTIPIWVWIAAFVILFMFISGKKK